MYQRQKHIIISWLLLVILIIPSVWQLEHVFDNNHGVVYKQNHLDFKVISDASCAALHKQLQFHSTLKVFVFKPIDKDFFTPSNMYLPAMVSLSKLYQFSLRVPPLIA